MLNTTPAALVDGESRAVPSVSIHFHITLDLPSTFRGSLYNRTDYFLIVFPLFIEADKRVSLITGFMGLLLLCTRTHIAD